MALTVQPAVTLGAEPAAAERMAPLPERLGPVIVHIQQRAAAQRAAVLRHGAAQHGAKLGRIHCERTRGVRFTQALPHRPPASL